MKLRLTFLLGLIATVPTPSWAYGGGGSSTSCAEPKFFTESPANNSVVDALTDYSFIASDTDPDSLTVKANGTAVPVTVIPMPNGDLKVSAHLAVPVTVPGRVQIAVTANSKDGCSGFQAYYVQIK